MTEHSVLRARARAAALAAALALATAPGCASPDGAAGPEPVEPRFAHAVDALGRAVQAGEDEVARRILSGLLARGPDGRALELARAFEAVLDGRRVRDALGLVLSAEDLPDAGDGRPRGYRLALDCSLAVEGGTNAVVLWLPPPTLELLSTRAYPPGNDARTVENRVFEGLHGLVLEPGEAVRFELGEYHPSLGEALAQRDLWTLHTRSGEAELAGRRVPLAAPEAAACEVVRRSNFLPTEDLTPEGLAEYTCRPELFLPALMERTVRIPPDRWQEALELLAERVDEMDDDRIMLISPALRWLSRSARIGADPRAWRRVLSRGGSVSEEIPGLDLPEPDGAPPSTRPAR